MVFPLIWLKVTKLYRVPDVCHFTWTDAEWEKLARYSVEPLVIWLNNTAWGAIGIRLDGAMLYSPLATREACNCVNRVQSSAEVCK